MPLVMILTTQLTDEQKRAVYQRCDGELGHLYENQIYLMPKK